MYRPIISKELQDLEQKLYNVKEEIKSRVKTKMKYESTDEKYKTEEYFISLAEVRASSIIMQIVYQEIKEETAREKKAVKVERVEGIEHDK